MNTTAEHTKGIWEIEKEKKRFFFNRRTLNADGKKIAVIEDYTTREEEAEANAELIVRAVNSFPRLVEALNELLSAGQEALDYKDGSGKHILQEAIWKHESLLSDLRKA